MPDLEDILASGDIVDIKVGGPDAIDQVKTGESVYDQVGYTPVPAPTYTEGKTYYNEDEKTLDLMTETSEVTVSLGQETVFRCINNTGVTITNGTPVRVDGASGGYPQIVEADATLLTTAIVTGVATHDIDDGEIGYVVTAGIVRDVDLSWVPCW